MIGRARSKDAARERQKLLPHRSRTGLIRRAVGALTLIELMIVVVIVAILSAIAMEHIQFAKVRASVVVSRANIRQMVSGIEAYRVDQGAYPWPHAGNTSDPYGVVAGLSLPMLTTPIAYAGGADFYDPFGAIRLHGSVSRYNQFGLSVPVFNPNKSLLYFNYRSFAILIRDPQIARDGFGVIGIGPDQKDSFGVYQRFPDRLPSKAADYGISAVEDTFYDPTNGLISPGDLTGFGGDLVSPINPE